MATKAVTQEVDEVVSAEDDENFGAGFDDTGDTGKQANEDRPQQKKPGLYAPDDAPVIPGRNSFHRRNLPPS